MTGPRTVADMYGTGTPLEDAPQVTRTILDGGEDYAVDVDLTPAAAVMLEALAAAVNARNPGLWEEWLTLMRNDNPNGERRAVAVRELLASEPVRRALTLRLTPETADHLREALDGAALEPGKCEAEVYAATRVDPAEGCPRYVEDGEHTCPQHSEPDDTTDRYGI